MLCVIWSTNMDEVRSLRPVCCDLRFVLTYLTSSLRIQHLREVGFGLFQEFNKVIPIWVNDWLWIPAYLVVNGTVSIAIAARIMCVTVLRRVKAGSVHIDLHSVLRRRTPFSASRSLLLTVGRALVESAFIAWMAVLMMLLFDEAPQVCTSQLEARDTDSRSDVRVPARSRRRRALLVVLPSSARALCGHADILR
jgi:hypothetical protein